MADYDPDTVSCNGELFELYLTRQEIGKRVAELGAQIEAGYQGKQPVCIGVLNGAFIFFSDLIRHVQTDLEVDFVKVSSYGNQVNSSGEIYIEKRIDLDIRDRHVVLVEDIVDTGRSVRVILDELNAKAPASLSVATLLYKPEGSETGFRPDYVGFEIPNRFVLGYGMDYAQKGRNLSQIYVLKGNGEYSESD